MVKRILALAALLTLIPWGTVPAQEKGGGKPQGTPKGPPPALVAVAPVTRGETEPMTEFVGTIYYSRTSEVAAEVEGLAKEVFFEEGARVDEGQPLVRLNADILDIAIEGTRATYEEMLVDQEEAEKSLARMEPLFKEGSVAEVAYDEYYFKKKRLEKKAMVLRTALDRQLLEKEKATITAPFAGLVVRKTVEAGEWISEGGTVAVIADDSEVDAVVNVPGGLLQHLEPGRTIDVASGGGKYKGRFVSFVPQGDVATRTFAVKIRLENTSGLVEGMAARATVPVDRKTAGLVVPRDAVVDKYGRMVVFVIRDGKAAMVPVTVTGHDGLKTGVEGPDLEEDLDVVVKGNERLRDGQPVRVAPKK